MIIYSFNKCYSATISLSMKHLVMAIQIEDTAITTTIWMSILERSLKTMDKYYYYKLVQL